VDLSIVIPVYNEEANIWPLYDELKRVLDAMPLKAEVIFVDDGSGDGSFERLEALQAQDARVIVIRFRRNFGQTAALSAGFDHARGEVIITMDADLQNDPRDIPLLMDKMQEGYELVNGWRRERKDPFFSRRLPSMIANRIISLTTGVHLHDYGCTLKAFHRQITENIKLYGEMHRFIPAIASGVGGAITEVVVNHRERRFGRSKYGIGRTIRVILDLMTVKFLLNYATRPIQVFGLWGFVSSALGLAGLSVLAFERIVFDHPLANRPMLLFFILLLFIGFQFITLGLLAELQSRTYHEAQNKCTYFIRTVLGETDRGCKLPSKTP
jgi:glycosyltransferase involved in cell wall biosynthesis